jgi:hypothetical protein
MPIRAYEIFIFTLISDVKQWKGDQYNGGVGDVVCIAGMVESGGSMSAIVVVIVIGMDNAGLNCFIHGHMVLNMCRSNRNTDLAKGAYYNMKNQCGPMISDYH